MQLKDAAGRDYSSVNLLAVDGYAKPSERLDAEVAVAAIILVLFPLFQSIEDHFRFYPIMFAFCIHHHPSSHIPKSQQKPHQT